MITYKMEIDDIKEFGAWGGAEYRLFKLDGKALELANECLAEWSECGCLTEGDVNDWLWFECEDWLRDEYGLNLDGTPVD